MTKIHHSDQDLLLRIQTKGESQWLGVLFTRYHALIFGVCNKYLQNAEESRDAVMEIFEKLHLDIKKHEIQHFKSWLYRVAQNHCLMKLRKAKIKYEYKEMSGNEFAEEVSWAELQEEKEKTEKTMTGLEKCVENLKEKQKECIDLFYLKEKSYKEIETETGLGFKEVKTHIQNGKLNLKKCLQQYA